MAATNKEGSAGGSASCKVVDSHLHVWASPQQAADKYPYFPGQESTLWGDVEFLLEGKYRAVRFNPNLWPSGQKMTNEVGRSLFAKAAELGAPVGIMVMKGISSYIQEIEQLCTDYPATTVILDHMAFCKHLLRSALGGGNQGGGNQGGGGDRLLLPSSSSPASSPRPPASPIPTKAATMAIYNFICEHGSGDWHFRRCDRDSNYVPTIPSRYRKYAISQDALDASTPQSNDRYIDTFRDELATGIATSW